VISPSLSRILIASRMRRPAHAKHGDHVALADALAGFQPSGDDGISQSVHHPVADQLRLEEPDGRRRLGCRLLPL
jgi:hypothetical protein